MPVRITRPWETVTGKKRSCLRKAGLEDTTTTELQIQVRAIRKEASDSDVVFTGRGVENPT